LRRSIKIFWNYMIVLEHSLRQPEWYLVSNSIVLWNYMIAKKKNQENYWNWKFQTLLFFEIIWLLRIKPISQLNISVSNSIVLWNYMIGFNEFNPNIHRWFQTLLFFEIIWLFPTEGRAATVVSVSNSIVLWNYMIVQIVVPCYNKPLFQTLLFFEIIWLCRRSVLSWYIWVCFKLYCSLKLYDWKH